jgi:hypothetical protein
MSFSKYEPYKGSSKDYKFVANDNSGDLSGKSPLPTILVNIYSYA